MKEFKVKATFPEGDKLFLTVIGETTDAYLFKEKEICSWWYKELCIKL